LGIQPYILHVHVRSVLPVYRQLNGLPLVGIDGGPTPIPRLLIPTATVVGALCSRFGDPRMAHMRLRGGGRVGWSAPSGGLLFAVGGLLAVGVFLWLCGVAWLRDRQENQAKARKGHKSAGDMA